MSLLQPIALFFLLTLPLIALFYMLRVQRQDVIVSSLLLWRELKEEASERLTWRPPVRNVLLILQLIIAALLAFALARPAMLGAARPQKNVVYLVDASGSMQATDIRPSRFAEAKNRVRAAVSALNTDDTATVIRVADRPTIMGAGSDKQLLLKAIDDMAPGVGGADMKTALTIAKSLSRSGLANEIEIYSDGGITGVEEVPEIPAAIKFNLIGQESFNIGVTSVSARPLVAGGSRCEGFARVVNYGDRDAQVPLSATVDGSPIEQRILQLPARGQTDLWFDLPAGARLLEVKINPGDALPLDDVGQALCPRARQVEAMLFSDAPSTLQTALGLLPNVKLATSQTGQYTPGRQADLYIFEGMVPERLPQAAGNLLIIGPRSGGALLNLLGQSTGGLTVTRTDAGGEAASVLLAGIDAGAIQLGRIARIDVPEWGRSIADTEEGPLVVVGETGGRRVVVLTFDLDQATLPQKLQFPLLIANCVRWLLPDPIPATVAPAQALVFQPFAGVNEIVVERPTGETETFATRGESITYTRTEQLGRYRVYQRNGTWIASEEQFVVGPLPAQESRIRPNNELVFNTVDPGVVGLRSSLGQEIWPLLALLGLGLLGVEWWWFYCKR